MARLKNIVHSQDACTMIFEGNPKKPEPVTGIIKFPGGDVEVTRCSNNKDYWVHVSVENVGNVIGSRLDHTDNLSSVPELPDHDTLKHFAILISPDGEE